MGATFANEENRFLGNNLHSFSDYVLPESVYGVKRRTRAMSWINKFFLNPGWMVAIPAEVATGVPAARISPASTLIAVALKS